jgi:hypothetical protein
MAASAASLFGQTAAPNEVGISMGHVHLVVADVEAQKKAWIDAFGAQALKAGPLDLLKLPGVFIVVSKGMPNGGSNGSSVNHIGVALVESARFVRRLSNGEHRHRSAAAWEWSRHPIASAPARSRLDATARSLGKF